ncbi:MAG: DUF2268 domain-containing putative Zn-dependent protease [Bdellovibrionota bacterium]
MLKWIILCTLWSQTLFASSPQFINLKNSFKDFVADAKDKDFETQLLIWRATVENAAPDVYLNLFGSGDQNIDDVRRARATKWFPFLLEHSAEIIVQFDKFENSAWPIVLRLTDSYPSIDFSDVQVIALPSLMMFDGMVVEVKGKKSALFGMDFFEMVNVNPELIPGAVLLNNSAVIASHEFTHILHGKLSDFGDEDSLKTLFDPLWKEGLALVNSQSINPSADLANILMEQNLTEQCKIAKLATWATQFISDNESLTESNLWQRYGKWFFTNQSSYLGVPRAGYCLGYIVVTAALKDFSLDELFRMDSEKVYILVDRELRKLVSLPTSVVVP